MLVQNAILAYSATRAASWVHSPATLEAYSADLKWVLAPYLKKPLTELLEAWRANATEIYELFSAQGRTPRTLARKSSALRDWWRWLEETAQIPAETALHWMGLIPEWEFQQALPKALTEHELNQFLTPLKSDRAPEGLPKGLVPLWPRDRALLLLFICTGMRVSEAVGLRMDQCDFSQNILQVTGKRGKSRWLPFPDWVGKILQAYIETLRPRHLVPGLANEIVFLGSRGHGLTRQAVWKRIKQHALISGLDPDRAHPHVLRHTFATDMLHAGLPLRALQLLLGHASSATTEIYTHVSPEHLAEVHARCHPFGEKK